jgi:nicotinamidase/pyrazinamidase
VKTAFIDVDTQIDFVFPAGALYVPGAELVLPNIARLNQYTVSHELALVSTVDAHSENDPEFRNWPPHCVIGTVGQLKPQATVVSRQTLFEKKTTDAFASPKFVRAQNSFLCSSGWERTDTWCTEWSLRSA